MSKKILIVGPAWIGDMVIAHALVQVIKANNPQSEIDVLAPAWVLPIVTCFPEVYSVLEFPFKHGEFALRKRYQFGKALRAQGYDQAIVLPNSWKSALIPFFAKIPQRSGWLGEARFGLLNDIRYLNKKAYPRLVDRYVALGLSQQKNMAEKIPPNSPLGKGGIDCSPLFQRGVRGDFFELPEIPSPRLRAPDLDLKLNFQKPLLVLCPGAEYGEAKRWPAAHFAAVANKYYEKGWEIVLLGSKQDREIGDKIVAGAQVPLHNWTGETSLIEAIGVISQANAVVTNDSGLMHVAAALDKPLVAVYGSSDKTYTPPLNNRVKALSLELDCSPCFERVCPLGHLRCLKELLPEQVMQALDFVTMAQIK